MFRDDAGNQTSTVDAFGLPHIYTYDAENRIVSVDAGSVTYTYDGDGQRVMKNVGGAGPLYWRGSGPDVMAESDLAGNITGKYIFFNGRPSRPLTSAEGSEADCVHRQSRCYGSEQGIAVGRRDVGREDYPSRKSLAV